MAAIPKPLPEPETIAFTLDGREVHALPDETILEAGKRVGVDIPYLCYQPGYRPDGNCRACVVEIKGERALAPSCCRKPTQGMDVRSDSERARHSQKLVVELLLSDMPDAGRSPYTPRSELDRWADWLDDRHLALPRPPAAGAGPHQPRHRRQPRRLHPVHALRARLPRGAGQRRDRLRLPGHAVQDRLRPRRPHGQ